MRDDAPVDHVQLVDPPDGTRRVTGRRRVRLGDVTPSGRLRLDAVSRYLQDIAADDVDDAGVRGSWVTRRVGVVVHDLPRYGTPLEVVTSCTGAGPRWAERRSDLLVDGRAVVQTVAIWVYLDGAGRPAPLPPGFFEHYGAAAERRVSGRLVIPPPTPGAETRPWPLRRTDVDLLDHVNNAIGFAAVEDELARRPARRRLTEARIEYRAAIDPGEQPDLVAGWEDDALTAWLCVEGDVRVAARVEW